MLVYCSCRQQTTFLVLQFTLKVALGAGTSHYSIREGMSWQGISCARETLHALAWWLPAKNGRQLVAPGNGVLFCLCVSWCGVWKAAWKLIWPWSQYEASQSVSDVPYCPFPIACCVAVMLILQKWCWCWCFIVEISSYQAQSRLLSEIDTPVLQFNQHLLLKVFSFLKRKPNI